MKKLYILLSLLLCLFITGCNKAKKIEKIVVDKNAIVLYIGETDNIKYECFPEKASKDVIWESNNTEVATVKDGTVSAINSGNAVITITSAVKNEVKTTVNVTVLKRTYQITYNLNDGKFLTNAPNTYQEGVGLETLPEPVKEGYEFNGWYLNDELVTSIDKDINQDITLVAKWTKIVKYYTIKYVLNGGRFDEEVPTTYEGGVGLETLPVPIKAGYEFVGWFLNNELIDKIDPNLNKNVTLSGRWAKVENESTKQADEIIKLINLLPYNITYTDKEQILNVKALYDSLDDDTKTLVTNSDVLNEKWQVILDIENNISEITYVLGEDIALSKDELFVNFFSDFYFYIKSYHGSAYLESKGITSVEKFIALAGNYNAGGGNMTEIGYVAGSYMLKKDINGILANQPETGFFGYCYKNNLYVDLLPFFIRFFAYWRIDERYANLNNYGADTFAESWAPTVDIAKFFYYDENTTYVKTERMLDCFNFTSNVVYGDLPTQVEEGMILPTDLKLRGYVFEGWYDNPLYEGDKIEKITDTSKKIILYAKWGIDTKVVDKDNAALVDVYIYNLTTKQANVTKQTVQYVRDMYEALSTNGKSLVTKYNTLLEYENKFKDQFTNALNISITTNIEEKFDIEFIRNNFMNDFNTTTNSSISSLNDLITKHYSYMDEMSKFYSNPAMRGKWGYLLDVLYTDDCYRGLKTQINRVKKNESGDLEYFTKALGNLLLSIDASSESEILVDYSTDSAINKIINGFGTYNMTFTTESYLPIINIDGYEFVGYYDEDNNLVTKITENTKSNLVAVYNKKDA